MKSNPLVHIKVSILNDDFYVTVCWGNLKEAEKYIVSITDQETKVDMARSYARYWSIASFVYMPVIYVNLPVGDERFHSSLAHEAVHAINAIWEYIGEESKDEIYAHSIGAIVHAVDKELNNRGTSHE